MKLAVVLVLLCAVAALAWQRHEMENPADAQYLVAVGEIGYIPRRGMRFVSSETTSSPYTLPSPKVVVVQKTCDSSACPDELGDLTVDCDNSCFRSDVLRVTRDNIVRDPCIPRRWQCHVVDDGTRRQKMLELVDSVVVCEDGEGRPAVNAGQHYLPGSCFVKVALVDHTQPEPVKRENPMLRTSIQADRDAMEL